MSVSPDLPPNLWPRFGRRIAVYTFLLVFWKAYWSIVQPTTITYGLLLAIAHLYAGFSLGYVALLAGGLFADALRAALHRIWKQGDLASWATATVLTAVPVVVTVGLAIKAAADNGGY